MIFFLIPSFNEGKNFPKLFEEINKFIKLKYRTIIVDDGSTDGTKEEIKNLSKSFPVQWIGYKNNKGPGYAFKFGFNHLLSKVNNGDLIITMEADNTSDYKILNKMIDLADKADVVLASPNARGGKFVGISPLRSSLSKISNILDQLIFRVDKVKTYSSFYRVYNVEVLFKVRKKYGRNFITDNGFSAVVELLIKLSKSGATFLEVPAIIDWTYRGEDSKMKIKNTILRHLILYGNYFRGKYN